MKRFSRGRPTGITYVEVLAVIGLIVFLVAILIPSIHHQRGEGNGRVQCASNMRQIGQAILLYANENRGAYPRTVFVPGDVVTPIWGTGASALNPFKDDGPKPNDVTAALFLLLRTQEITSEVFTCPTSNEEKWDFGGGSNTAMNWSNWEGAAGVKKHLSYSYQNPYPDQSASTRGFKLNNSISAEFAVAADINPGSAGGDDNVLAVTTTSSSRDMKRGNSKNHDRDGQNVLYGDGHVEFQQNPFVGVARDNIYTRRAGSSTFANSGVVASPYDLNDSVLLPTDD